jgi:hypothetical protein
MYPSHRHSEFSLQLLPVNNRIYVFEIIAEILFRQCKAHARFWATGASSQDELKLELRLY